MSKISLTCPNIANWYVFAKNTTAFASLTNSSSALSELGTIISGITSADIALVSSDSISSISNSALQFMPANTINSMSTAQLTGLSANQVTALQSSPNYASFSTALKSGLTSLSTTGIVIETSVTSAVTIITTTARSDGYFIQFNLVTLFVCFILDHFFI